MCVCLRFSWRYQLREFKSEFRVVAIDMRGYGESDLPLSTESYRFEYLVTDVKDIVEYLGEETRENCVPVISESVEEQRVFWQLLGSKINLFINVTPWTAFRPAARHDKLPVTHSKWAWDTADTEPKACWLRANTGRELAWGGVHIPADDYLARMTVFAL